MERVFWIECPECEGEFYANHKEMRHAGVRLLCPFCHHRFLPEEAKSLDEREDTV